MKAKLGVLFAATTLGAVVGFMYGTIEQLWGKAFPENEGDE